LKCVIWNYRFPDFKESWRKQLIWVVNSLKKFGIQVKKHPNLICQGLETLKNYNCIEDNPCDIVIYNHTDSSHIIGNVVKSKVNWFFKPTVPDEYHTTLDELGYGPYSLITYNKPDFENISSSVVKNFFDKKVKKWIDEKSTKYGRMFKNQEIEIEYKDYFLVLGQCGGDEVVSKFDFGNYFSRLESIITELVRISDKLIIVKLHPYTDGTHPEVTTKFSESLKARYEAINLRVKVFTGKINIHNFIKNSYCVLLANSGAGFEVMMHKKPMVVWGFPEYHYIAYDLRHLADLNKAIKLNWYDQELSNKYLYWYMEKYCFYNQETCNYRVEELLKNVR